VSLRKSTPATEPPGTIFRVRAVRTAVSARVSVIPESSFRAMPKAETRNP
jgi:hypothetical protein